ncbi:UbiA family prenyltransferase [Pseudonocardia sp.]|jgi:protoheme IX farnesyltransferase|uniref:UbiA family prenyltransferase n=1 Tax=Pseudonocardia sp. TaxID=60912 RepID=UPI0031FD4AB4
MRRFGTTTIALLRACHPEPTAAVTLMVTALAVTTGHTAGRVVLIGSAVLTGQLSIGWLNDVLDAERDRTVGRADKPVVAGAVSARTVGFATAVTAAACVPLSLACGVWAGVLHLVAVAAGWAYDLGLKSTPVSVLPYIVCFGLLPAFVVVALPGSPAPPWWLPVAGALVGAGAHFANVLPDLEDDAATGVRGLPHRIGAAGSRIAAAVLLLAATVVLALAAPVPAVVAVAVPVLAAAVLAAGFRAGRRPGSRAPFRAVLVVAGVAVVLLVAVGPALVG